MKILSPSDIINIENWTIANSTSAEKLMEEAGHQAFLHFQKMTRAISTLNVWVCCGPGNNGGDGLALARQLMNHGAQVEILILSPDQQIKTPEAQAQLKNLERENRPITWISNEKELQTFGEKKKAPDWLVDSVFGIGLNQPLKGMYLEYVDWVSELQKTGPTQVCSMDIPTGLNATTGHSLGASISADVTLSFEFYKKGFYVADGLDKTGKISCLPIGMVWNENVVKNKIYLANETATLPRLPLVRRNAHKNSRGHAFLITGSKEKSGAAVLASLASMRAGVGLCTVALPSVAHTMIKGQLINVMSEEIPSNEESVFEKNAVDRVLEWLPGKTGMLMGPGLAPDLHREKWIEKFVEVSKIPMVLDAQALTDLGEKIETIDFSKRTVVITPHPGEMSRLTGLSTEEIQANRFDIVETYSKKWKVTIILKGSHTMIGFPTGEVWVNQVDHPCLSVAGTGDVLSGILVGLLAQGISVESAARLAVYIHGRAGERLGERIGVRGVLASDLLNEIPMVISEIHSNPAT